MLALIIATDETRRLAPLTDTTPAALLPIVDRPAMATTVEILARAGVKRVLISLHERGGPIAAYFGSGKRWGISIEYITQREAWGSAGALRWAAQRIGETCLVLPGDAIIDLPIEEALASHQSHGAALTAITHQAVGRGGAPTATVSVDGRVTAVSGSGPDYAARALVGAYIIEPSLISRIPARTHADIAADLIPTALAAGATVQSYDLRGYWNPLATLADYQAAQQVYLYSAYPERAAEQATAGPAETVRYPSLAGRQIVPGVWVGLNHSIHPSARIAAPVYIGAGCWVGHDVELGPGSVIGAGCVVDDEATVSASTVLAETYVGRLVKVEGRVVSATTMIDPATGDTTRVVDPFLLSRVGAPAGGAGRPARVLNALVALGLLLLLSPLLLLAGLLALIGSGGRPLVGLPRLAERAASADGGQALRALTLWQLRTRRADGSPLLFGQLIERAELHRLPELLNVLRGELLLVGVKPLSPAEAAQLSEEWQQRRNDVAAGITGLWYQQTTPASDLDTVLVADVYYSATRTWRGDLLLLLRTPAIWLRRIRAGGLPAPELRTQTDPIGRVGQ